MNNNIEKVLTDYLIKESCILIFFQENTSYKVNVCDYKLHIIKQLNISDWEEILSLEGILLTFDFDYQIKVNVKASKSGIQVVSTLVRTEIQNDKYVIKGVYNVATRPNLIDSLKYNNDIILEHFKVKNNDLVR